MLDIERKYRGQGLVFRFDKAQGTWMASSKHSKSLDPPLRFTDQQMQTFLDDGAIQAVEFSEILVPARLRVSNQNGMCFVEGRIVKPPGLNIGALSEEVIVRFLVERDAGNDW